MYNGTVQAILAKNIMGTNATETPKAPVSTQFLRLRTLTNLHSKIYMYHGKSDEIIPYASAAETANAWCANGANITFTTEVGGAGHLGTGLAFAQNATDWLDLRLNGTPVPAGCTNTSVIAGGLPLKREESKRSSASIISEYGVGDSKWIATIKSGSTSDRRAAFAKLLSL